jgi:hypothetical protein
MRRSSAYPWTFVESWLASYWSRHVFANVRTYAMFIGQPRSGTSLVGSLLNAHPHTLIAHELNALRYFRRGYGRRQVYWLLLQKDREFGRSGRNWTGYNYAVPEQWQGRFEQLWVIGDKKAGCSSEQLGADPNLMQRLQERLHVPIRILHVVRNPLNVIATIHRKRPHTPLELAVEMYFSRCQINWQLIQQHSPQILTLRLEDLIAAPELHLRQMCAFLDLRPDDSYVQSCARILFDKPRQSQQTICWPERLIDRVRREMETYPFLADYVSCGAWSDAA